MLNLLSSLLKKYSNPKVFELGKIIQFSSPFYLKDDKKRENGTVVFYRSSKFNVIRNEMAAS